MKNKKIIAVISGVAALLVIGIAAFIIFRPDDEVPLEVVTQTTSGTTTTPPVTTTEVVTTTYPPFVNGLSEKAQEAKASNSDTVGWIRISNTVIDYPVVQTSDNDYYVTNNFYEQPDPAGWVFMDFRSAIDQGYTTDNILMYGHNMANGTMFSDLKKYLRDESFYESNPIVEVSSLTADYQYKIFAFMLCDGTSTSDFQFWNYVMFSDTDEEWSCDKYLSRINDKSLITTNVDVKKDDSFLLLSTCNTGDPNDGTRFVVLARRVRPGEEALAGTTGSSRR
ncbi:MAG: class B sortase [Oscillospiraceae bacterium]|nr:class B sortase [Oscillospiraceae bacterium]